MAQQATATAAAQFIPAEAAQLAAANQLGTPTAVYKAGIPPFELVVSLIFLLLGVGWVVLILGSKGLADGGLIGALIGFVVIGIWGLLWPLRQLLNSSLRVYVCTEGLLRVKGGQSVAIRWDQVEWVKRTFTIRRFSYWLLAFLTGGVVVNIRLAGKYPIYKIRRMDGVQIKLGDALRGLPELGDSVCNGVNRVLLPKALAAVRAGMPVTIGAITATQQGLTKGKKTLPWANCVGLQIFRGAVVIKEQGKNWSNWYAAHMRSMPNYFVLASLIDAMKRGQQPGTRA